MGLGTPDNDHMDDETAPNPVRKADLVALIGWLAVYEGQLMIDEAPEHLTNRLRERLIQADLLDADASTRDLMQAINDLNHRLRYALGEHEDPPKSADVAD